MRSELLLIEKIEQYLEGTLNPSEHTAFEKEIAGNVDLQNEVSLQKELISGLQRSTIKKDVAVAFLKYKKIALLFKLGMIGASAIVGTAVTVGVVHYVNKNNQNDSNNTSNGSIIVQVDSIKNNDSTLIDVNAYNYTQDSLSQTTNDVASLNENDINVDANNNLKTSAPKKPMVESHATNTGIAPSVSSIPKTPKDSVAPPITKGKPVKPKKGKDTRLSNLFWTKGAAITWLGVDFTNAKLVGKFSELTALNKKDSSKNANSYFKAWNDVIIEEKRKYNFNNAFYTKNVNYSTEYIYKSNDTIKAQRLFINNTTSLNQLNPSAINKIVSNYKLDGKEGLGLVFIVESFDKLNEKSSIWVTIIDMKTNEILLTEKMIAKPSGSGLRDYWANCFDRTIREIETKKYPEWKDKHKL